MEDRIQTNKGKSKELIALPAPSSGCASDIEGSDIGNFTGLKAPERKRKAGRPTTSRDKPPYDDQGAESKKYKRAANAQGVDGCGMRYKQTGSLL